jgi:hypothetical protein
MTKLNSKILTEIEQCAVQAMPDMQGCKASDFDYTRYVYCAKVCRAALTYYKGQMTVHESQHMEISMFKTSE